MVLLCDGRLVCGCADPYGKRVLGDVRTESLSAVWTGERTASLRRDLNTGGSKFCGDCPLKLPLAKDEHAAAAGARCARRCRRGSTSSAPPPATSPAPRPAARRRPASRGRDRRACSTSSSSVASWTKPGPRSAASTSSTTARRSCTSARSRCASTSRRAFRTSTSTRAPTAWRSVASTTRTSAGSFAPASTRSPSPSTARRPRATRSTASAATSTRRSATFAAAADEKRRSGRDVPFINWRYILFTHNDSERRCTLARTMADEIGVDRLCWEITDHPEDMFSRRFLPGTRRTGRDQARDLGRQQPRQRDPRRDAARPDRRPRLDPGPAPVRRSARAGRPVRLSATIQNLSTRPFPAQASYGRRLVRLGAQLCDRDRTVVNRDYERAWLPATPPARRDGRTCRSRSRRRTNQDATG